MDEVRLAKMAIGRSGYWTKWLLDEVGLDEVGLANGYWPKWLLDKVGLDKVGLDKVGLDKVGLDKVGLDEVAILAKVIGRSGFCRNG